MQRALPQNASLMNTQRIGHRAPLYCTGVGKIFLAAMDDEGIERYCSLSKMESLTHKTLTSYAELFPVIQNVRSKGYAFDDEECEIGVKCIAVAIRNRENEVKASISVSGAASLFNREGIARYVESLQYAAQQIGQLQAVV